MRVPLSQALRLMLFLGTMGLPRVLPAQRWLVAEAGTFLTREGGWNWELNVAGSLGIMHVVAPGWRGTARVIGRVSACPCGSPAARALSGAPIGLGVHSCATGRSRAGSPRRGGASSSDFCAAGDRT
jgi:hypothetical protein